MSDLKTKRNTRSVDKFLKGVDAKRHDDCQALVDLMAKITGEPPAM